MATVTEDLVNGHRATYVAASADVLRTFYVTDLVAQPWAQLDEALTAPGIPNIGQFYPSPPVNNLRVIQKDAEPFGKPNAAIVRVLYSNKHGPTWSQAPPVGDAADVKQVTASVRLKRTTRDETDTPMTLAPPPSAPALPSYLSEADVLRPVGGLVFERTESAPPSSRMRAQVGTLNQDSLGGGNYPARTLLFASLDAQSDDGGANWRVVYTFQFDPDGWEHRDAYKLQSGRPLADSTEETFNVYSATLFGALGLDFSDSQTPL